MATSTLKSAIGAAPTPIPPASVSPNAYQTTGGQIYSSTPKQYTSQGGISYGQNGQIMTTSNNSAPITSTVKSSTPATTAAGGGGGNGGGGAGGGDNSNPNPNPNPNPGPSAEQKAATKYKEITGDDPTADLLAKWKAQGGDLEALADQNAQLDMQNANREYEAVMSALGGQKDYVKGSAENQRERAYKREGELKTEADVQSEKDQAKVQQEKESYDRKYEEDKSSLAQNWKDISRITQALSRASGRQDSSFGDYKETSQLMDFNKGLRVLASGNQDALTQFGTAISDTLDFYRQEKANITRTVDDEVAKVDDWEKAQITSIQGQEGVSLAKKFSDINNATKTANGLKMQIQQNINDKVSALDTFLLQTKVNFQNQVALLAKSKAGAASVDDQIKTIQAGLNAGILNYRKIGATISEGTAPGTNTFTPDQYQVYGTLPGGKQYVQDIPQETYDNALQERKNKQDFATLALTGQLKSVVN